MAKRSLLSRCPSYNSWYSLFSEVSNGIY